eukprot:13749219-Ditylum_brightwellii.AAC.1
MQEKQQISDNQENIPHLNTTANMVTQSYQPVPQFQPLQQMVQQSFTNMTNYQYPVQQQSQLYQTNNKWHQKKRRRNQQQQPQNSGLQNQVIPQQQQGGNPQHNPFIHKYCWTHGGCNHWRPECWRPAQGHQQAATFQINWETEFKIVHDGMGQEAVNMSIII